VLQAKRKELNSV
jgi:hypothetical protein